MDQRSGTDIEVYLTVSELARLLSVPVNTVYQWNSRGTGPAFVHLGKHVRYRSSAVREWLATRDGVRGNPRTTQR